MTENELRQKVVNTIKSWHGAKQGDKVHKSIIDLYNSHKPLARGYKMTYSDYWCATTVSAVAVKLGITDIMPTECGCISMTKLYKKLGRYIEDDSYKAKIGDIIFYEWDDNGVGDCPSTDSDHVGIITKVSNGYYYVEEGNMGAGVVGERKIKINGRYICGFAIPDYAKKAKELSKKETVSKPTVTLKPTPKPVVNKFKAYKVKVTPKIGLNIRKNAGTNYSVLGAMPYNTVVTVTKEQKGWGYISWKGIKGWISLEYTKKI